MPTIKELAREAGVSPSTVSIVLGGKSEERGISPATQQRFMDVARRLGYQTNVSARRLRSEGSSDVTVLALFWASDFRAPLMVRFLRGIQKAALTWGRRCEIVIHTYENNRLQQSMEALGMCNAAIICNASPTDQEFLESYNTTLPIVLYNRHSTKYCTVNVDDAAMGSMAATIFAGHGYQQAVLMASEAVFEGMDQRSQGFTQAAQTAGMSVLRMHQENSAAGGYQGAMAIASLRPLPDCVFTGSDAMAIGALRAFAKQGIRVPDDVALISIGNGDKDQEEYSTVSLSVVLLPMEAMASECFRLATALLSGEVTDRVTVTFPTPYVARESCAPAADINEVTI